MTRRHSEWITWGSEVVGGACGAADRDDISKNGSKK